MNRRMLLRLFGTRWRILSGALMLAFLLRAMIPAGYMPAQSYAAPGPSGLTFCVKGLPASIANILAGDKSPIPATTPMPDCVFGIVAGQAVLPFAPIAFIVAASDPLRPAIWRVAIHAFQLAVRGPPLGSRAPPVALL
ncbi:MAG: hypothetical protein ACTS5Y_06270 [Pollutimonas bauzanensis]